MSLISLVPSQPILAQLDPTLSRQPADFLNSVRFQFYSGTGSHSVALSAFDTPCQPAENGFYSGIIQGNREGVRLPHLPSSSFPTTPFIPPHLSSKTKLTKFIGPHLHNQHHLHLPPMVLLLRRLSLPHRHGRRNKPTRRIPLKRRPGHHSLRIRRSRRPPPNTTW